MRSIQSKGFETQADTHYFVIPLPLSKNSSSARIIAEILPAGIGIQAVYSMGLLTRAFSPKHDLDRLQNDDEIEHETLVFDVIQIVLKLFNRVFHRRTIRIA